MSTASIRLHRSSNPAVVEWETKQREREDWLASELRKYRDLVEEMVDRAETLQPIAAQRAAQQAAGLEYALFGNGDETRKLAKALGLEHNW